MTVTGRVRTDQQIVQAVLEWARRISSKGTTARAEHDAALAALGRLVEARDTAQANRDQWHSAANENAEALAAALSDVTPPHDNGESPVDDPECGTDIGPFAAGAVDE